LNEFKHSSAERDPNLKDRRKAMIEQIHFFSSSRIRKKIQSEGVTGRDYRKA